MAVGDEMAWYESIQSHIEVKKIMPQYYGEISSNTFSIELCSGSSLQDMLVYDNIRPDCWKFIIDAVLGQHQASFYKTRTAIHDPHYMFFFNIKRRLSSITTLSAEENRLILQFLQESYTLLEAWNESELSVIHGDFHFGNIIYDATCNKVKAIDPRGRWDNVQTTAGYVSYDMAKFYQSFYAKYAWIVSNETPNEKLRAHIIEYADQWLNAEQAIFIKRYSILLLLSAVPLHSEDQGRQARMIKTGLQLIQEFK
jgi:thiamine kinase-like enzyme